MAPTHSILAGLTITFLILTSHGTLADADIANEDSLASAVLGLCLHEQDCIRERMSAEGMDPAITQMIEAGWTGQCEAQLQMRNISGYEGSPHAQKSKECYQAMTALSCAELAVEPTIPACEQ